MRAILRGREWMDRAPKRAARSIHVIALLRCCERRITTSPRLVAFAIFGMCGWTQYWWNPMGPIDVSHLAGLFSDMITSGVQSPAEAAG